MRCSDSWMFLGCRTRLFRAASFMLSLLLFLCGSYLKPSLPSSRHGHEPQPSRPAAHWRRGCASVRVLQFQLLLPAWYVAWLLTLPLQNLMNFVKFARLESPVLHRVCESERVRSDSELWKAFVGAQPCCWALWDAAGCRGHLVRNASLGRGRRRCLATSGRRCGLHRQVEMDRDEQTFPWRSSGTSAGTVWIHSLAAFRSLSRNLGVVVPLGKALL